MATPAGDLSVFTVLAKGVPPDAAVARLKAGCVSRHLRELVEPDRPGGQPAVAALQRGQLEPRMAIEDTRPDRRGHVALSVPDVAGGALQEHAVPRVPEPGGYGTVIVKE